MTLPRSTSMWPDPQALGPVTDLYQLTMMAGYAEAGMAEKSATFELFVRRLPEGRSHLVFAGLEQAVETLTHLKFDREQVDEIRTWPVFERVKPAFWDRLANLRFEGDVWSVPEGSVVFAGEPLVRVQAPLLQAQWVETILIASLNYPTLVASKAARIVEAARGRSVVEFGARRGHGAAASFLCARSAYIAGFDGTSQVEAARRLGIPAVGTMAHSWVQSFEGEGEAFEAFCRLYPRATLLVDTFDTAEGIRHAASIEPPIGAIRIDSGDLLEGSVKARRWLDELDRRQVRIVVSGDLDEYEVDRIAQANAPVDVFGVGTELITGGDAPSLSMVYKLVEIDGAGRVKKSESKRTYPLAKQIDRRYGHDGRIEGDRIVAADEPVEGRGMLERVIASGKRLRDPEPIDSIRDRCVRERASLPDNLRGVRPTGSLPMTYSDRLEAEARRLGLR